MAEVTQTNRRSNVIGNRRLITAQLSIAASGDTWDSKLKRIDSVMTSPDSEIWDVAVSGGVVTFTCDTVPVSCYITAIGLG